MKLLIFVLMHFLNVNRTFHFKSLQNRRFVILLSASQFFYNTCFFKFSFVTKLSSIFYSKIKDKNALKRPFLTDLLFLLDRFILFI